MVEFMIQEMKVKSRFLGLDSVLMV